MAPYGIDVNRIGTRVYVANGSSNNVSVIDTATNTVVATVAVGNSPAAFGKFIGPEATSRPAGRGATSTATAGQTSSGPIARPERS